MKSQLILLFCVVVAILADTKTFSAHECVKTKSCLSHDFVETKIAESSEEISFSFAVKLSNVDKLYEIVRDVSYPNSPNYGKHRTFDEMGELTANPQATKAVIEFLSSHVNSDQISFTKYGGFVRANMPIQVAEKVFQTRFFNFKSDVTGQVITRTYEINLPTEIADLIDYVFPTVQFPPSFSGRPVIKSSVGAGNTVTPAVLNSYYNITSNTVTSTKATQSLFESLGQSYSPSDLTSFQKKFGLPVDGVDTVIGPNDPSACSKNPNNCAEANLDVQYIMAVAQKALTTFWSEANSFGDIFYKWIEEVASYSNPPLVHSISYGSVEDELEEATQERFSQEAAKLGSQGVTIVVSSGDDGVANFVARTDKSQCGFHPSYPATVPYVVAVGATMGPESGDDEIACTSDAGGIITSGGGFSTTFAQPDYQTSEVDKYLANSTACPPLSQFEYSGRGYPDVAMAGYNYEVVINSVVYEVSGTSASAPVFAGVLTLVNNARLNKGKSAVGWVNPALYSVFESTPYVYNDVTVGKNNCCAEEGLKTVCCTYGFACTPGWDPVTGLGSVNVGDFVQKMASL